MNQADRRNTFFIHPGSYSKLTLMLPRKARKSVWHMAVKVCPLDVNAGREGLLSVLFVVVSPVPRAVPGAERELRQCLSSE